MTEIPSVRLRGGREMPLLGFGTWQLSGRHAYDGVRRALDVGYRSLDTATMYGNEREVGRALADSGVARDQVFVTTKLPPDRVDRARATLEQSLAALGVDRVDLWLIHWPPRGGAFARAWDELLRARHEGLAAAVGVSNYSTADIDELVTLSGEAPEVNQIKWSPSLFDPVRLRELRERGVVVEGYSPFKASNLRAPVLVDVATAHGVSVPQVILRWHLQHDVVVIPKSADPARIAANFEVTGFSLTDEEMARIDALGG